MYDTTLIGANFCQVIRIKEFSHDKPSITLGNHKWKGALPNFNIILEVIIIDSYSIFIILKLKLYLIMNIIDLNKKIIDANTWVKKYLIADSEDKIFLLSIIRGINDNKLISNPIQIPNQEDEERVIIEPTIIIQIKIFFEIKFIIKKKRIITFINGVWTQ